MRTISQKEAEFSASFFNELLTNYPLLIGVFYKSTMGLKCKLLILNGFLSKGDLEELPSLIEVFKNDYDTADISKRNEEWKEWFNP